MKITILIFRRLPNGAHCEFFGKVKLILGNAGTAVITALGDLVTQLDDWYVKERACLAWFRKSEYTAAIAEADKAIDKAIVGLIEQVTGACHSADSSIAKSANRLLMMLKSHGKITTKSYLDQKGIVETILEELNGAYLADLTLLNLTSWKTELAGAMLKFMTQFDKREKETLKKPQESFPEVRRGIEKVWHEMVDIVDSLAKLNLSTDFVDFINAVNPEIDYLNNEFRRIRYDISTAEPAPINAQQYTGEVCTPVPEVIFRKGDKMVKLIFSKDFTLTYKNNINVGNAYCIIHGKGAYKGTKTINFIIKHF
jgi:hypothetical protein